MTSYNYEECGSIPHPPSIITDKLTMTMGPHVPHSMSLDMGTDMQ